MKEENQMILKFKALSENEGFARICVSAFLASYNPTIDELGDIKTAVSEAVTNCVVHAYPNQKGDITINVNVLNNQVYISVEDYGCGIEDVDKAKQPFYTSKPDKERSGMGFTVMEGFMDKVNIISILGQGTKVEMYKYIGECAKVAFGG